MSDWEKHQKKVDEKIEKLGSKKGAPAGLKRVATKAEREEDVDADIARKVFSECLTLYLDGEYSWKEFCTELSNALKVLK